MQRTFWLRVGTVAGRTGPNTDPWCPDDLAAGGIGAVLSVNDGELVDIGGLERAGIDYECVPLSDAAPPGENDDLKCIAALPRALSFVESSISRGRAVLVHCRSGKDRTGLFLAYYLNQTEGLSPAAAIAEVRRVRPIALSAPGWEELALVVLGKLSPSNLV